ncbi:MAG: hypothetical protein ABUL50_07340, partial [Rhizobacter sp.]
MKLALKETAIWAVGLTAVAGVLVASQVKGAAPEPRAAQAAVPAAPAAIVPLPGMPPVADPRNLYSATGAGKVSAVLAED